MKIRKKSKAKSDSIPNVTETNENAGHIKNPTTLNGINSFLSSNDNKTSANSRVTGDSSLTAADTALSLALEGNPGTLNTNEPENIAESETAQNSVQIGGNTMEPSNSDGNSEHKSVPTSVPSLTEILTLKRMILVEDAQGPSCSKANITGNSSISVESMSEILAQLEERLTAVGWSKELFKKLFAIITERKLVNINNKNLAKEISASAIAAMPDNERKAMVEQIREIIGKASAPKIFK